MHRLSTLLIALLALLALAPPAALAADAVPEAATGPVTDIGRTTATFTGSVDPNSTATTYRFEYGTTTSYGLTTDVRDAGAGADSASVSVPVTGLTAATAYHVRIVATNAAGEVKGEDRTFTTLADPQPPAVTTGSATRIGTAGATLRGSVDPEGQETTVWFEYGTSTRYGSRTPDQGAGSGTDRTSVAAAITGLRPRTTYHFRLVARNATGTTRGGDRRFTTLRSPTGVTAVVGTDPAPWGGSTTITGRVTGSGISGISLALQRSDFPFAFGFREVALTTASSDGSFRFTVGPLWALARLRVVTRTTIVASTGVLEVRNRPRVGLKTFLEASRIRVTGAIWPAFPNGRASLQRRSAGGRWVPVVRGTLTELGGNRSRYALTTPRPRRRGAYRVVITPNDSGAHVRGFSRQVAIGG